MTQRAFVSGFMLAVIAGMLLGGTSSFAASCTLTSNKTTVTSGGSVQLTAKATGYAKKAIRIYEISTTPWTHIKTFTTNAPSSFSGTHTVSNLTKNRTYRLVISEPSNSGTRLCVKSVSITVTKPAPSYCVPATLSTSTAQSLGVDPWYKRYCRENGILILSSNETPNAALVEAARVMRAMLGVRPDVWEVLRAKGMKVAIVADTEKILDIPEYRSLPTQFPGVDYSYPRGLGATDFIRVSSASEENLLCYANDPYREESIKVHEFAHSIMNMGLTATDTTFASKLIAAYLSAKDTGKWANTYAMTTIDEYWAEGVQSYFDTNVDRDPVDGIHNHIDTRDELAVYDPSLYAIINQAFAGNPWKYQCPTSTATTTMVR